MGLRRFRLHRVGPFEDVTVDLDALEGPLVALVGPNGAGKTSLCEFALCAAQYRDTPNQGTLADRATSRDAFVESWFDDLRLKQLVGEALAQRGSDVLVPSGKIADYKAWARKTLPAEELFYAGIFGAQGAAGFLGMTAGARKSVILRALGIERIEAIAKKASERHEDARRAAVRVFDRLTAERAHLGIPVPAPTVEIALAQLQDAVTAAADVLADATTTAELQKGVLARVRDAAAARALALSTAKAHDERTEELRQQRERSAALIHHAQQKRGEYDALLADAGTVRADAAALDERRRRVEELERAEQTADAYALREGELRDDRLQAQTTLDALTTRRDEAAAALTEIDAVRTSAGRLDALRAALAATTERGLAVRESKDAAERDITAAAREKDAAERAADEYRRRLQEAERVLLEGLPAVEKAEQDLPQLRADVEVARAARDAAEAETARVRALLVDGRGKRIEILRGGFELILDNEEELTPEQRLPLVERTAREHLDEDTAIAAEHDAAPAQLRAAELVLSDKARLLRETDQRLGEAERRAERRPEMDRALRERDTARACIEHCEAGIAKQAWIAEQAEQARDAHHHDLAVLRAAHRARARDIAEAEKAASRLTTLAGAEATIRELDLQIGSTTAALAQIETAVEALGPKPARPAEQDVLSAVAALRRAEGASRKLPALAQAEAALRALDEQLQREEPAVVEIDAKLAALGSRPEVPPDVDVASAEREADVAQVALREAAVAHSKAEAALVDGRATADRIASLEAQLHDAEQLVADWAAIEKALGREGIQALLIDAAGPELTALVNDLLRSCFGPRFTVKIETQRAKKDGKGDREVCDVLVLDAKYPARGWREGRLFSGGEKTILGEAIALALTALSCRRAGIEGPVIVRDESAGLDNTFEDNVAAYVTMLRRAAEIVGASKVIFILHNCPEAWAMADSVLLVRDGQVVEARVVNGQVEPIQEASFEERQAA